MSVKTWVLRKVNRINRRDQRIEPTQRATRGDEAALDDAPREPTVHALYAGRDVAVRSAEHLGPYATLIGAIRDELEQFAASPLRLHLAIAERDRYLLTSIDVQCDGNDEQRELLRRFREEFRPEQIKHYLAKEVIAGLRNAAAIDLSQFGGLDATRRDDEADDDVYSALLDELRGDDAPMPAHPYKVTLVGRWSELDTAVPATGPRRADLPQTPLAGRALDIDVEDADGARRVSLASVLPGRRYVIGKGEGCDIVVNGVYASRRHCEIWLEQGAWHAGDCGSTNGIRVESARGVVGRFDAGVRARPATLDVPPGASIVLSAHARGDARLYPRVTLRAADTADAFDAPAASAQTPVTPIAPARRRDAALTITVDMVSGVRSVDVGAAALPFGVGRSRNQALVVDWTHEDVSGHHFDIVALDAAGATVVVHGDNGVRVGAQSHGPGARFCWKPGETLVLGSESGGAPMCKLTLARAS